MSSGTRPSVVGGDPVGRIAPAYLPQTKPFGEFLFNILVCIQAEGNGVVYIQAVALIVPVAKDQRGPRLRMRSLFTDDLQILLGFKPFIFAQHERGGMRPRKRVGSTRSTAVPMLCLWRLAFLRHVGLWRSHCCLLERRRKYDSGRLHRFSLFGRRFVVLFLFVFVKHQRSLRIRGWAFASVRSWCGGPVVAISQRFDWRVLLGAGTRWRGLWSLVTVWGSHWRRRKTSGDLDGITIILQDIVNLALQLFTQHNVLLGHSTD